MCVCMCVYIFICACIYIYIYIYMYWYIYIYIIYFSIIISIIVMHYNVNMRNTFCILYSVFSIAGSWEDIFSQACIKLHSDADLNTIDKNRITQLLDEVLEKYCSMSVNQLRKTYMETFRKEKEEAHRKQIKIRKDDYATKCDFNFIMSHNMKVSHHRLQVSLWTISIFWFSSLYKRSNSGSMQCIQNKG